MIPDMTQPAPTADTHVEINEPAPETETRTAKAKSTRRKSSKPRRNSTKVKTTQTSEGFAVPVGDAGETFQSVWQFGE